MKKLTDEQIQVMTIVEQSLPKLKALSERAIKANLVLLAGQLVHINVELENALKSQTRTFRDNSLIDPEPLFPEGRFPYGKY